MCRRRRAVTIGVLAILIGLMANGLVAEAVLSLLAYPDGARIRPMGQAAALFYSALVGLCGGAVALVAVQEPGTRCAGVAGLFLGLSPFPLGVVLFRYVQEIRHLVFLP